MSKKNNQEENNQEKNTEDQKARSLSKKVKIADQIRDLNTDNFKDRKLLKEIQKLLEVSNDFKLDKGSIPTISKAVNLRSPIAKLLVSLGERFDKIESKLLQRVDNDYFNRNFENINKSNTTMSNMMETASELTKVIDIINKSLDNTSKVDKNYSTAIFSELAKYASYEELLKLLEEKEKENEIPKVTELSASESLKNDEKDTEEKSA